MTQLIIFRGIQGIGFGIMMTLGMIIMADLFPPSEVLFGYFFGQENGRIGVIFKSTAGAILQRGSLGR